MNDDQVRNRLVRAYDVEMPAGAAARIRVQVLERRARRRPLALWARGVAAAAVCLASGLSFPVVSGNLFCQNLIQRIDANDPYSMVITSLGDARHSARWDVVVSHGNYAVQDRSGQIWMLGSEGSSYSVDAANKVSCYTGKAGKISILQDSTAVLKRLATWDLSRRVKRLGTALDGEQKLDRYRLSGSPSVEVDVDPVTGLPVTALIGGAGLKWAFECRYSFDPQRAQTAFRAMGDSFTHLIDMTSSAPLVKSLSSRDFLEVDLGRDRLRVYDFARMPSGAVFLLYTFSGYHDGQSGSFVRLRDKEGREWLPTPVDLSGAFKLGGHGPVGQIFFPPADAPSGDVPTGFWCMANHWEVEPEVPMNPLSIAGYSVRSLGRLTPTAVVQPPDWFYFGKLGWYAYADFATVMQAHAALAKGKFELASRLDALALARLKDAPDSFYYSRAEVLLDLCLAHEGLGRRDLARADARAALSALSPGLSSRVERGIEDCARRESL